MASKKESTIPANIIALYDKLIGTIDGLERKGATVPYTSLNGHMTSYLAKDGSLALRLPKSMIEEFITKYNTKLCEAYGIVQKEYVVVPDALLKNTKELKKYFAASYTYVASMKPKATKRGSKPE
jgi:hypothetical protein